MNALYTGIHVKQVSLHLQIFDCTLINDLNLLDESRIYYI